jgi:MoxR-like ATPase
MLASAAASHANGERDAAREQLARALERLRAAPDAGTDPLAAELALEIATLANAVRDFPRQLEALTLDLRFCEQTQPDEHPLVQRARVNLGALAHSIRRPGPAQEVLERAVCVRAKQCRQTTHACSVRCRTSGSRSASSASCALHARCSSASSRAASRLLHRTRRS